MSEKRVIIVGGGLAGSEAAWQVAERGIGVDLYEMRPLVNTGAHVTPWLAELVCSNSLGSDLADRAAGILKRELRLLNSMLLQCAEACAVPAGGALAVDRNLFAQMVTHRIENHPRIRVIRQEVAEIPDAPTIIASGPLTSSALASSIQRWTGQAHLFFYDAIAPIVMLESINMDIAFRSSRYGRGTDLAQGGGDYINCPLDRDQYEQFVDLLIHAERIQLRDFEAEIESGVKAGLDRYFEGCLPIEVLARRGKEALAFGPMRPVGLINPHTGRRPYAVVQLRQDDLAGTLYNMVGFQTNLTFPEQRRVFRTIPGLENAVFERYGQMHRNTFICSPVVLKPSLQSVRRDDLFFAGQITGVEGYAGNIATGLLAGINMVRYLRGEEVLVLPNETMIGALCHYITHTRPADFQPMKANLGLLPELPNMPRRIGRREKGKLYCQRSEAVLSEFCRDNCV